MKDNRYCGVVVWYNPDIEVVNNISTYITELDKLYIIDNSYEMNMEIVDKIIDNNKIEYISLGGNRGLAYALNKGCNKAIDEGFDYILTMDQDSYFELNSVKLMKEFIKKSNKHYAIIAPNVKSVYIDELENKKKIAYTVLTEGKNKELIWVMTSGSMMCVKDFVEAGKFDEKLFIAHIDIDLGIALNNLGKKIIMLSDVVIYQTFGNSKPKKILWKVVHPSFANPVRTYYLFRNQVYLLKKYGIKNYGIINVKLYKFIVKIILFEDKKLKKILMAIKGIFHGLSEKMGKYS